MPKRFYFNTFAFHTLEKIFLNEVNYTEIKIIDERNPNIYIVETSTV